MKAVTGLLLLVTVATGFSGTLWAQTPQHHHHEHSQPAGSDPAESTDHSGHAGHSQHGDHSDHGAHAGHDPDDGPTQSEQEHVPPPPPTTAMHPMTYREMTEIMGMDDRARVAAVTLDQLEWRAADEDDVASWDIRATYGGDYDRALLRSEGEWVDGATEHGRAEFLWDHVFARWWSVQGGVRQDFGEGPSRTWIAIGAEGLAPYWFDVEAALYAGESGRTAARFSVAYELLFTQRLILEPEAEVNLYGRDDPATGVGSGLSDLEFGIRLRYEVRREFAPYVGVVWTRYYGDTADFARAAGEDSSDVQFLAGVRTWF